MFQTIQNTVVTWGFCLAANFPMQNLTSADDRHKWVTQQVQYARDNFLDGINVDFESAIPKEQPKIKLGLTLLIQELATAFRQEFVHTQVHICQFMDNNEIHNLLVHCYSIDLRKFLVKDDLLMVFIHWFAVVKTAKAGCLKLWTASITLKYMQ